jgi:hypothetical protein
MISAWRLGQRRIVAVNRSRSRKAASGFFTIDLLIFPPLQSRAKCLS